MRFLFLTLIMAFLVANTTDEQVQALVDEGQDRQAVAIAETAAQNGETKAHEWLGWFYDQGRGVEVDLDKAVFHYRVALNDGHNYSRWRVGILIDEGKTQGTLEEAVALFKVAADDGFTNAMVSTAVMKATGRGTPTDYDGALEYYMRAARAGNGHGIQGVGVLFSLGQGVEKNIEEGAAWFLAAAYAGNDTGEQNFVRTTKDMSSEEMQAVVERANEIAEELGIPANGVFEPQSADQETG